MMNIAPGKSTLYAVWVEMPKWLLFASAAQQTILVVNFEVLLLQYKIL